ncbi:hypothetical protein CICLE_v10013710mg, partial [Citrus x clementina]
FYKQKYQVQITKAVTQNPKHFFNQSSCFLTLNFILFHFTLFKNQSKMADGSTATCVDILLAVILPPLGVFLKFGCKAEFWICLLLTILGYIPGIIYAVYAITKK